MKNYKMINEAITVAEDLLKQEKQHYEIYVGNTEFQIKNQICEYIYKQLSDAEFPKIQGFKYINNAEICFNSGDYEWEGKYFQYQLFIRNYTSNTVSRIFFNREEYYESEEQPIEESTLINLIENWDYIKKKLSEAIDIAYQNKINTIKRKVEEIKRKKAILEGFKL